MGERFPGGRLKPQPKPDNQDIPPALMGRMRLLDPRSVTELGRLACTGQLTRTQEETGYRIGDVYRRWHQHQRLRTSPKSATLEAGFSGGADVAEERLDVEELERLEAEIARAEAQFFALRDEIQQCPRNVVSAVLDVCVYDVAINPMMYGDLRTVLTRMSHWFQVGGKRRKGAKDQGAFPTIPQSPPIAPVMARKKPDFAWNATKALLVADYKETEAVIAEKRDRWTALRDRAEFEWRRGGDRLP